jgi:hypothetical protein
VLAMTMAETRRLTTKTFWGDAHRGLRLGAALERDLYAADDAIELVLAVRNEGPQPVQLVESHLLWEYRFVVALDGLGEVPMSEEAQRIEHNLESWHSGARRAIDILPDTVYVLDWKAPLHRWFEIDRPGSYGVQAQRKDWRDGEAVLTSGTVRFEVR